MTIIDTHTHLFTEEFDEDWQQAVDRAVEAGVGKLLMPAIDEPSLPKLLQVCQENPGVCFPMLGLHPTELGDDWERVLEVFHNLLKTPDNPYIAVGEVGLDFYWERETEQQQRKAFRTQVEWAVELDLPLMIHCRSAQKEMMEILFDFRGAGLRGVFHCFGGTPDEARELLSWDGFMLGIGGVLTYKKSTLPDVLKAEVPLNRIVLETDSPYLAPVPHRGKRNESAYIVDTARKLADVYGVTIDEVASITTANAEKLFFNK